MGLWLSRLVSLFGEKEARILVLGLDNAGKTTILCKLHASFPDLPSVWWVSRLLKLPLCADRLQVGEVVSTIPSTFMSLHTMSTPKALRTCHRQT